MDPFMQLFRQTASLLLTKPSLNPALTSPTENYALLAQAMVLLVDIYYDFSCQDLPPAIEDSHEEFFGPGTGWFQGLLLWNPTELPSDVRDCAFLSLPQINFTYAARRHHTLIAIAGQDRNPGDCGGKCVDFIDENAILRQVILFCSSLSNFIPNSCKRLQL